LHRQFFLHDDAAKIFLTLHMFVAGRQQPNQGLTTTKTAVDLICIKGLIDG